MSIEIKNGIITNDGKRVGKAFKDFKYGYHPIIKVEIGHGPKPAIKLFEIDEPDLLAKIADFTREKIYK